jgi:hypothetical protein
MKDLLSNLQPWIISIATFTGVVLVALISHYFCSQRCSPQPVGDQASIPFT